MRTAMKQHLAEHFSELERRVYDLQSPQALTGYPAAMVLMGSSGSGLPGRGERQSVVIRLYAKAGGFAEIDRLGEKLIRLLHEQSFTTEEGSVFRCRYLSEKGSDTRDEALELSVREYRFAADALISEAPTDGADLWLDALALWSEQQLGGAWTGCRGSWPPDYSLPAVLWRVTGCEVKPAGGAAIELRKQLAGHVLGRSEAEEQAAVLALATALGEQGKIPLSAVSKAYMTAEEIRTDLQADPLSHGQLTLTLARRVPRPEVPAALMQQIHYSKAER
ncbi:hypothetical protein [Paenibacillus sp. CAA11]|uniref:hypothetical protein n=1 Tax=Paenibacillus sp. CAA11 TaxID=1532905 RepID=UPI00131F0F61|nr:hypothetical protein [Paenibacillus sp. CAA11]